MQVTPLIGPLVSRVAARVIRRATSGSAVAAMLLMLTGCAAGMPETIGSSGIDELVIPTPDPAPSDFVTSIGNPYLPLRPGSVWEYRSAAGGPRRLISTVTVSGASREIQGIRTRVVRSVVRDDRGTLVEESEEYFAEDGRGNVWRFGRKAVRGSWLAGVGGAEAGLAMAAEPRVGDGYSRGRLAGVSDDRSVVITLAAEVEVPAGDYSAVHIDQSTPLDPGREESAYYARGVGLVRTTGFDLTRFTPPQR
ncbi:MAG: hypothetical protein ACRCYQ_03365 [Nocardioides sp.]